MVLHPFGDDLKPNFHVHTIVTTGGLSKDNQWLGKSYIPYEPMRKIWQYEILSRLREYLPEIENRQTLSCLIDWCFKEFSNGFVVFADSIIKGSKQNILNYAARYLRHPPISNRRILNYDGHQVSFSYESSGKQLVKTMPKFEFIQAVLQHTSAKQFKMVRRFGIYSRKSTQKYQQAKSLLPEQTTNPLPNFSWRKNLVIFGGKDPLTCHKCGQGVVLDSINYYDKFGFLRTVKVLDSQWEYDRPFL